MPFSLRRHGAPVLLALTLAGAGLGGRGAPGAAAASRRAPAAWQPVSTTNVQLAEGMLTATSCPSASFCMAVGWTTTPTGDRALLAESWNGSSWSTSTPAAPGASGWDQFLGVSCLSATACMAVGSQSATQSTGGPVLGAPLAQVWNGHTWSSAGAPPLPAGVTSQPLLGVSCPSTTLCMTAGGSYTDAWNGKTWTLDALPGGAEIAAVSCATTTDCVGVGANPPATPDNAPPSPPSAPAAPRRGSVTQVPSAAEWNGKVWAVTKTPNLPFDAELRSVTCWAAKSCLAVGRITAGTHLAGLAETFSGGSWSQVSLPAPAGNRSGGPGFEAAACASATSCVVTGALFDGIDHAGSLGFALQGTKWTAVTPPASAASTLLTGASCATASSCMAVGGSGGSLAYQPGLPAAVAASWRGSSWSNANAITPPGLADTTLLGVACPTATGCVAVGSDNNVYQPKEYVPYVLTAAGHWSTLTYLPLPRGAAMAELRGVACAGSANCVAVGYSSKSLTESSNRMAPLTEQWNGSKWTAATVHLPLGWSDGSLAAVSCPGARTCVAVGAATHGLVRSPIVATWNGATWTAAGLTDTATAGLVSVSCPTTSWCAASGLGAAPYVVSDTAGSWAPAAAQPVRPANSGYFTGISCWATGACMGVGQSAGNLSERLNAGTWSLLATPSPGADPPTDGLTAVTCPSASRCVAVGTTGLPSGLEWNGASWATLTTPGPAGASYAAFAAVACPSTTCTAVGSSDTTGGAQPALVETGS